MHSYAKFIRPAVESAIKTPGCVGLDVRFGSSGRSASAPPGERPIPTPETAQPAMVEGAVVSAMTKHGFGRLPTRMVCRLLGVNEHGRPVAGNSTTFQFEPTRGALPPADAAPAPRHVIPTDFKEELMQQMATTVLHFGEQASAAMSNGAQLMEQNNATMGTMRLALADMAGIAAESRADVVRLQADNARLKVKIARLEAELQLADLMPEGALAGRQAGGNDDMDPYIKLMLERVMNGTPKVRSPAPKTATPNKPERPKPYTPPPKAAPPSTGDGNRMQVMGFDLDIPDLIRQGKVKVTPEMMRAYADADPLSAAKLYGDETLAEHVDQRLKAAVKDGNAETPKE